MKLRRTFTNCCSSKHTRISIDFDDHQNQGMVTYDGLESCILKSSPYRIRSGSSGEDAFAAGSMDDDGTSSSSCGDPFCSSSHWGTKEDFQEANEWDVLRMPQPYTKQKPPYILQSSDMEVMKEAFARLLLGEDVTGGRTGITSARALSNAIMSLGASVFGELWKLEPLPEEKKSKWRKGMDWFLSPASHMIELVPAKKNDPNGHVFEIMTPKARGDVHMNLPALQKLDSLLIEILDSMDKAEFWYSEGITLSEGRDGNAMKCKRWTLPFPRIPKSGLSEKAGKKLLCQGNLVHQVFKAAKSINEDVLHGLAAPGALKDAVPRSARACLGEELFKALANESSSAIEIADTLSMKSDHQVLDTINNLEAAALVLKDRISELSQSKSSARRSWPFLKDSASDSDKMESMSLRVEALLQDLKMRFPYLPHSFLDAMKVQHSKDVGHSILEAYSRVLKNLACNMLSRIVDILEEDHLCNPASPLAKCSFAGVSSRRTADSPLMDSFNEKMIRAGWCSSDYDPSRTDSEMFSPASSEAKTSSAAPETPGGSCVWCISTENGSPDASP